MKLVSIKKYFKHIKWLYRESKPFFKSINIIIIAYIIQALTGVSIAVASKKIIDNALLGNRDDIIFAVYIFIGIVLLSLSARIILAMVTVRVQEALSNSIRQRIFSILAKTQWESITKYHSGDVLTRLTSDIEKITNGIISVFPEVICFSVQLVASFFTLLYYEPLLAILAFVMGPITVIFSSIWGRRLKNLHNKVQESESGYRSFIQEAFKNILIVKSFQYEERCVKKIVNLHKDRLKWVKKRNNTSVLASSILAIGYWVGYIIAFIWGAFNLAKDSSSFGTLTAFIQLVEKIQMPFVNLARSFPKIIACITSTERLMELENLQIEEAKGKFLLEKELGIIFDNISFNYMDSIDIFNEASLIVEPGEKIGIIGKSGEGKTTLIRLLLALIKPSKGNIIYYNKTRKKVESSADVREYISYVPQGNTLFSGTIAENIKFGKEDATNLELKSAAICSCAWDFIKNMPEGLDTVIGESGIGLSEGQAQRIGIARALIKNAPILILDEVTSALDAKLEERVFENINKMQTNKTCIIITHKPYVLRICNRVLNLKGGKIIDIT